MSCNQNPLDPCNRRDCQSPCHHEPGTCPELLPTQIDTFVKQFFGEVGKSNVGGSVAWSLPCGLDVGIAANPRLPGESVACYFLRLFEAGLTGTQGMSGAAGADGVAGEDAFSFTRQDFDQPSVDNPYISIAVHPSASLVPGLFYQIENSGWFQLQNANPDGSALFVLIHSLAGTPAIVPAGSLIVASGMPGVRVQGPTGGQGATGATGGQGPAGLAGATGPQGALGPAVSLLGGNGIADNTYTSTVGGVYADWSVTRGPVFDQVVTENSTWFMQFQMNISALANDLSPHATTGGVFCQLNHYINGFGGLIAGTEHQITGDGSNVVGVGGFIWIPLLINLAPAHHIILPASKGTVAGGPGYTTYIYGSFSMVSWIRIQ